MRMRASLTAAVAACALLAPAGAASAADEIVFTCGHDICKMDPDVPFASTNLTQTGAAMENYPVWSPSQQRIAYVGSYPGVPGGPEIYTMGTLPGGSATNVSNTNDRTEGTTIDWSPDSNFLAYETIYNSNVPPNLGSDVNVARADGTSGAPTPIGSTSAGERHPSWSPDGQRLVFARNTTLYLASPDGLSAPTILTGGYRPNWSPDGTRIAYLTGGGTGGDSVNVISVNGGTPVPLGTSAGIVSEPIWSPDSTRVAWIEAFGQKIFVRAADGSSPAVPIPHTNAVAPNDLAWSPDGTRLSFHTRSSSPSNEYSQIWIVKADGTADAVAITNSTTLENQHAAWKPAPFTQPPTPPTPTPENPNAGTRVPATFSLSAFRGGNGGTFNPYRMIAFINCSVQGYPISNHPACKAFGQGKGGGVVAAGLPRIATAGGKAKAKPVVILTARATIPGGKTGKLKFNVTKKGRKLLKPGKVVKVNLTIKVTQAGNKTVTKSRTLKLKAPKKNG